MVGAISIMLVINDTMLFSGEDLSDKFFDYYLAQPGRKYISIAAPQTIDATLHRYIPCIVAGKVPDRAPDTYHPDGWGHILASSLGNGSLYVFKITDYSSKIPEFEDSDAPVGLEDSSKTDEKSVATFDYPYLTRNLLLGKELPLCNDSYALFAISGDSMSDYQKVAVTGARGDTVLPGAEIQNMKKIEKLDTYRYAKNPLSPDAPARIGIAVSEKPSGKAEEGKPFLFFGSIRVKAQGIRRDEKPCAVHVLVCGTEDPDVSHYQIDIPWDMMKKEDATMVGYFSFDCMKEFFYKEGGRFDLPSRFFVTVISRDLHAGPVLISTGR
jgi:hypothetical protein